MMNYVYIYIYKIDRIYAHTFFTGLNAGVGHGVHCSSLPGLLATSKQYFFRYTLYTWYT